MRILQCLAILTLICSGIEAQESFIINADTKSQVSLRQWYMDGAEVQRTKTKTNIVLSSANTSQTTQSLLNMSFDKVLLAQNTDNWRVESLGSYEFSTDARLGTGAAAFTASLGGMVLKPSTDIQMEQVGDMRLEFWLKPSYADSGEIIMLLKASKKSGNKTLAQQISCLVQQNKMTFGFINLFYSPSGQATTISLQSKSLLVPKKWSHHLVLFNSATGLLEYYMNGQVEDLAYVTSTKKESGDVYYASLGANSRLELASNYTGLIDEFNFSHTYNDSINLTKYNKSGAVVISPLFDLGLHNSLILKIKPEMYCPNESAIQFFYRATDSFFSDTAESPEWIPFLPDLQLNFYGQAVRGRYIQLKMNMYPDAKCEHSPVLSNITIQYEPDTIPNPPLGIAAVAGDKSITVSWKPVSENDIKGYMIYYGTSQGEYFGAQANEGPSPIRVSGNKANSFKLTGLQNGTLYFIAVAAYDNATPPNIGVLSQEVCSRPERFTNE